MGQPAAVSIGAPFGRSIRVRFRIQMFRCMNWIAIKRLPPPRARPRSLGGERPDDCPLEEYPYGQVICNLFNNV
jgi:hypothetical protein